MNWINTDEGKVSQAMAYVHAMFSERVKLDRNNPEHLHHIENIERMGKSIEGAYTTQLIDDKDTNKLEEIFTNGYNEWKIGKKNDSTLLYTKYEISRANKFLDMLPKYMFDNLQNKYNDIIQSWILFCENRIKKGNNIQAGAKTPSAPAISLFCNLVNDAEIIKKENNEIPERYCKRICEIYSLKYTDRVRQNYNGNKSKKHYKELIERILPCIDKTTTNKIQKHLDSKNPPKQNLYA